MGVFKWKCSSIDVLLLLLLLLLFHVTCAKQASSERYLRVCLAWSRDHTTSSVTAVLSPPGQRCGTVCLNSFGNRTSPSGNSNDRWKRLCLVSWAAEPCVWTLRAPTRHLLTYLLTKLRIQLLRFAQNKHKEIIIAITTIRRINSICVASPARNLNDDGGDDDDEVNITCIARIYNIIILCSSRPITTLFCNCFLYTVAPSVWSYRWQSIAV